MKKSLLIVIIFLILLGAAGAAYWYFLMRVPAQSNATNTSPSGFTPFGRNVPTQGGSANTSSSTAAANNSNNTGGTNVSNAKIPTLRLLSSTPVGGYGASTTLSTTVIRWIDRGRGNVYEIGQNNLSAVTLSNTVVPRMYDSVWNKNLTAFVGSIFQDGTANTSVLYAELKKPATVVNAASTTTAINPDTITPFELKGNNLPDNIIAYAASPQRDKIFLLRNESGRGVGYVASFNGSSVTEIFSTPLTQLNVEWPEDNTIAITSKGSSSQNGFLYFVNPKNGFWRKILGPLPGLSTKVSRDAKYVLFSVAGNNQNILTSIYNVPKNTGTDAVIRTLADKCVWGNFYKEMVYCGVPSQLVSGTYPEDWYKGTVSFSDKVWQESAVTGEVHLISSLVDQSDRVIDAFSLGLDAKDNYLLFMNKNDLSLWSLDLVSVIK